MLENIIETHKEQLAARPELYDFDIELRNRSAYLQEDYNQAITQVADSIEALESLETKHNLSGEIPGLSNLLHAADSPLGRFALEAEACDQIDGDPHLRILVYLREMPVALRTIVHPVVQTHMQILTEISKAIDACACELKPHDLRTSELRDAINSKQQKVLRAEQTLKQKLSSRPDEEGWKPAHDAKSAMESKYIKEIETLRNQIQVTQESLDKRKLELEQAVEASSEVQKRKLKAETELAEKFTVANLAIAKACIEASLAATASGEEVVRLRSEIVEKIFQDPPVHKLSDEEVREIAHDNLVGLVASVMKPSISDVIFARFKMKLGFEGTGEEFRKMAVQVAKGENPEALEKFRKMAAKQSQGLDRFFETQTTLTELFSDRYPHLQEAELTQAIEDYKLKRLQMLAEILESRRFGKIKLDGKKLNCIAMELLSSQTTERYTVHRSGGERA